MPWVRIDENAMDHPKFLALSDGAWRLWCEAQTYCQKHLTNGYIPPAALKGFRYYSRSRVKCLTVEHVQGKGPCWHQDADGSIHVHDYLDWNESAETVLKARVDGRERRRRWHQRHKGNASTDGVNNASVPMWGGVYSGETPKPVGREGGSGETTLPARAGDFCEWYGETHTRHFGVGYIGSPQNDYQAAMRLVAKLTDDELHAAVWVWFGMDDDFATKGTRTIPKFASRATYCLEQAQKVKA